jgi:hypothetical protein
MSQYPILADSGQLEVLNYVASGPSGLGQNFQGYAAWSPGYINPNFRVPYVSVSWTRVCVGLVGENTVIVTPNASGIVVGMTVSGYGVTPGTTVTALGPTSDTGTVITLSDVNLDDFDNDLLFNPAVIPQIYIPAIYLNNAELLDPYTWKFYFATTQPSPPYVLGTDITVYDVDPSDYNGDYAPIGVVQCTTEYVIAKTTNPYTADPYVSGGYILVFNTSQQPKVYTLSTDCNEKITVTGGTDRVFISAQLNNIISYTATIATDLNYAVAINRYKGFPNNDIANPGYYFQFDKLISKRVYQYTGLNGTGVLDNVETVFGTLPDTGIAPGYYWYIMDVSFQRTNDPSDLQVTQSTLGLRSMSTQVVKE